ncbi:DUF1887 family protein [Synechococcales cyanobacterium C]|uniref:DUF1887 family protein n=1 Tax=Petrachloros mirabilis ULC683 TaxID=2781853 RepID=A0A8K1ZX02_9CYAN|nr:DUF1887 family CARF protein [Petrachloros mirabilis]NCJ06438.1 DUF1887 family protein [Petrachloros mirabilis ULC683]
MAEFDSYKVDSLFLLIGENPLPNYMATRLLLKGGGTPYLIYTTGTERPAQRLKKILDSELTGFQQAQLVPLEEYESDAYQIQTRIQQALKELNGQVGLNYTGGTKAMAVHAYRAMFKEKGQQAVFSYLDPRQLEMCVDREEGDRIRLKVHPEDLEVKIPKIFQIHGWQWLSDPDYTPTSPEAASAFAQFHAYPELGKSWREWCNTVLRKATRNRQGRWLKEKELKEVAPLSLEIPSDSEIGPKASLKNYSKIIAALKMLGCSDADNTISLQEIQKAGFKDLSNLCKWLDGEWLEDYTLQQVQEVPKALKIYESAASFWIKDPASAENRTKFQFDVAFTRGYQLFALSCTTIDEKPGCKQKLFESYIRARQLGGDEARVALVCCANKKDTDALKTEITNVFKSNPDSNTQGDSKLTVFGCEDLLNLSAKIEQWIRESDAEAGG